MPRQYKRREGAKKRTPVDSQKLKEAVLDVINTGTSLKGTASRYQINVMTLKRYVRRQRSENVEITYYPDYKKAQIFTNAEENMFKDYLDVASKLHHGLTTKQAKELAYEFAVRNNKKIPASWNKHKQASYDWLYGFLKRMKTLSLRSREATSLTRATSFNRNNVSKFFINLKTVLESNGIGPEAIWSIDETGLSTVHKPKKIIACKGAKQVGKITSGERGPTVTLCGAINAIGNHIPPFLVFPRKLWQDRMIDHSPPGTTGVVYESGWMTASNFVKFLEHFQKHVKATTDNKSLIIMDNHDSHVSLEAITYAKAHGIVLLTIPPHTSHKFQALDTIVFGPLKSFYNTACDDWMVAHPDRTITIYEVGGCLAYAFPLAFTPRNIESGFRVTGIWPFNSNIFTDEDFMSAYVTDREDPENKSTLSQFDVAQPAIDNNNQPSTSTGTFTTPEIIRPHSSSGSISHNQQLRRTLIEDKNQPSTSTGTFTTPQIIRSHSVNGDTSQN
ncbi:uncharacterized protein [Diabrotica undecimpunctata]|uniref:uncharacterized protein n=1 Tax=Diabrotica undecimpunctata TaxID=50387 RepID=UPI003B634281